MRIVLSTSPNVPANIESLISSPDLIFTCDIEDETTATNVVNSLVAIIEANKNIQTS